MDSNPSYTIRLTQEEVILILMRFRLPLIVGLNPQLTELSEEQLGLLMGAAERSLFAREILKVNEQGEPQLDPVILALVAACAKPAQAMMMVRNRANGVSEVMTVNLADEMVVAHVPIDPGIHQFTALPDKSSVPGLVESYLRLNGSDQEEKRVVLAENTLTQARELAASGKLNEAALMLQKEATPISAKALSETLAELQTETTFVLVDNPSGEAKSGGGFTLLEGANQTWMISLSQSNGTRKFNVKPATSAALREALETLLT